MKKIMVAIVAVVMATVTQAASFSWGATGTNASKVFQGSTGTALSAGTTVYLMEASVASQSTLIDGLRAGKTMSDFTTAASSTLDSGSRLTGVTFDYGSTEDYNFYMVVVDGDQVFASASVAAKGQASATSNVNFSGIKTATSTVFSDPAAAFSGAGWYATASVPEPTSGLLMLLGMAGLALRRRRA